MFGGEHTFRHHSFTGEETTRGAQVVIVFIESLVLHIMIVSPWKLRCFCFRKNNRLRGAEKNIPGPKEMKKNENDAIEHQYNRYMRCWSCRSADTIIQNTFKSRRWYLGKVNICLNNAWLVFRDGRGLERYMKTYFWPIYVIKEYKENS